MAGAGGAFVIIEDNKVGIDDLSSEILKTIEYTRDFADEMRVELTSGIENLNDIVETYNPEIEDIDTTVPTLDGPSFPERPTFGDLGLDESWPEDIGDPAAMMDYGDMDFEFVTPLPPDEISGDFNWNPGEYSSPMWQALFTKVHNDILDGGTGLTDAVHAAIVAREKETRRANQDAEYRTALDAVGSRGFNLPSGQIGSMQVEIAKEIIAKDQDSLNNITIKDFDMATENTRFMLTNGIELERVLRSTFESAESRSLEAAKAAKEFLLSVYSENVKLYLAKWEGVKIKLQALVSKIDAISSYNEGNIKVFLGRADAFTAKIQAITAKNQGKIDVRKGEVDVYTAEVDGVAKQYAALVEEIKVNMEGVRLKITSAIEESKLKLTAYSDKAKLTQVIAEAVSKISSQAVASALGAINTQLSNSYSGSESRREAWTHGDSLGETHSFSEE